MIQSDTCQMVKRIENLIKLIEDGSIIVNNYNYNESDASNFITSILEFFPIPFIYFDGSERPWKILDGNKRLCIIYDFYLNKFKTENSVLNGYFKDLPFKWRRCYLTMDINICILYTKGQEKYKNLLQTKL